MIRFMEVWSCFNSSVTQNFRSWGGKEGFSAAGLFHIILGVCSKRVFASFSVIYYTFAQWLLSASDWFPWKITLAHVSPYRCDISVFMVYSNSRCIITGIFPPGCSRPTALFPIESQEDSLSSPVWKIWNIGFLPPFWNTLLRFQTFFAWNIKRTLWIQIWEVWDIWLIYSQPLFVLYEYWYFLPELTVFLSDKKVYLFGIWVCLHNE